MAYTERQKARFWRNVSVGDANECWPWKRFRCRFGYGRVNISGKHYGAHAVAAAIAAGCEVSGVVLHTCDNPPCCNPAHLVIGTQGDNIRDMVAKGRGRGPYGRQLSRDDVLAIRAAWEAGVSQGELAKRYGVGQNNISFIVRRKTWRHVA